MLNENDLRSGLRDLAAAPPAPAERFAAVERRARRTRRRRQSVAAGLAVLAALAIAVPALLPERRVSPPATPATPFPRDVLVGGDLGTGVLAGEHGPVRDRSDEDQLQQPRRLPTGQILAVRVDQLLRLDATGSRELAPAESWFAGLRGGEVWAVEDRGDNCQENDCFGRFVVRRVDLEGTVLATAEMPLGVKPVGEVAGGLVAIVRQGTRNDVAVVDPVTGAVRRVVAEGAGVIGVEGGVLVWRYETCSAANGGCDLHVDERAYDSAPLGDFTDTDAYMSMSADGRWLAREVQVDISAHVAVMDLRTGVTRTVPHDVVSIAWSADLLLFTVDDEREGIAVGVHEPGSGRTRLTGRVLPEWYGDVLGAYGG